MTATPQNSPSIHESDADRGLATAACKVLDVASH
jgi:hypothetical protein